jgi:hypothetical protein
MTHIHVQPRQNGCTTKPCNHDKSCNHDKTVARQNKLEIPKDKDEVNKQDIHDCDGRAHDPDTMVAPLTPKPKRKAEAETTVTL